MIIKLNSNGSIDILPQSVPEPLDRVFISYIFPKGLNHLRPVLTWGNVDYEGQNKCISKSAVGFDMKVTLYNGNEFYQEFKTTHEPLLYVGYNIELIQPDICAYVSKLEKEIKNLKERGDII